MNILATHMIHARDNSVFCEAATDSVDESPILKIRIGKTRDNADLVITIFMDNGRCRVVDALQSLESAALALRHWIDTHDTDDDLPPP